MAVGKTSINVNNVMIDHVEGYVYLGLHYILEETNQGIERQRSIMAGWVTYDKHRDTFRSNPDICPKRPVLTRVMPAMSYAADTLIKQSPNKLVAAQIVKKYAQHHIQDRKTNIWVRADIISNVRK